MGHSETFPLIFLIARPAAGKSEVIDYLKQTPLEERRQRFHIGEFEEFDDFPDIWEMFEEDDILTKHGFDRVWTDASYYFKDHFIWNLLIEKLGHNINRRRLENDQLLRTTTAIVEFARGGENAFAEAFSYFDSDLLKRGAVLYIDVSYEESCRKNRRRARDGQEHSILHHSLPEEKMSTYYKINDWQSLSQASPTHLKLKEVDVPYAVLKNEPEVTHDTKLLGNALEETLSKIWREYAKNS